MPNRDGSVQLARNGTWKSCREKPISKSAQHSSTKARSPNAFVASYGHDIGEPPEFTLCLGDDFTDEDMFRALNGSALPPDHVFTVTVGASSKKTLAHWHLIEPADVISSIALLNGGDSSVADLGALAIVEGNIPEQMPRRCYS